MKLNQYKLNETRSEKKIKAEQVISQESVQLKRKKKSSITSDNHQKSKIFSREDLKSV